MSRLKKFQQIKIAEEGYYQRLLQEYRPLLEQGIPPQEVYLRAKEQGLDNILCLRLVRELFNLSVVEAKEVSVIAQGLAISLSEHQAKFIPALEEAFLSDESVTQEEQ
jgi:hypothetical protein